MKFDNKYTNELCFICVIVYFPLKYATFMLSSLPKPKIKHGLLFNLFMPSVP